MKYVLDTLVCRSRLQRHLMLAQNAKSVLQMHISSNIVSSKILVAREDDADYEYLL